MKKIIFILFLFVVFTVAAAGQQSYVTITVDKTALRGTPELTGPTVATLERDEQCEYFGIRGEWYLVQSLYYVGWIHKNTATAPRRIDPADSSPPPPPARPIPQRLPDNTPLSSGTSVFTKEYTGVDRAPTINVKNNTDRLLTLVFGGVKYELQAGQDLSLNVVAGVYGYTASAPRVQSITGVNRYENGYRYSWEFYIKTIRR